VDVKIVEIPSGQAPSWVREKWLGLVLPVANDAPSHFRPVGVLKGKPRKENLGGYPVKTEIAIQILENISKEAADWWRANISFEDMPYLLFGRKFCEEVPDN
jgi:hypothetical protein